MHKDILLIEPEGILKEIEKIFQTLGMEDYIVLLQRVYRDTIKIYMGKWPGFRYCQSPYHDLYHVTSVALAAVRIAHGACLLGEKITKRGIFLLAVASLFHDVGYIAMEGETPGAAHSSLHEERSVDFMHRYVEKAGWGGLDFVDYGHLILSTKMNIPTNDIPFRSRDVRLLGYALGTADLLAQMADRFYLEKLSFLFDEHKNENNSIFKSLDHVYRGTSLFYKNVVVKRLKEDLRGSYRLVVFHFSSQYGISKNLYIESVEKNLAYLEQILEMEDYQKFLRRTVPFLDTLGYLEEWQNQVETA